MVDMLYMHISTWRIQVQILVLPNFNKYHMGRTAKKKKKKSLWAGFRLTGSDCPIRSGYDNYNKPQF